jgi:hypothetical protein
MHNLNTTMRNCSKIMHNHSITPHNITRYPNATHHEEIEVEDEVEEDLDEA